MGEAATVHRLFAEEAEEVDDGLPENPSHIKPEEFTLVMQGDDIIRLWNEKLITTNEALLLIFFGLKQLYCKTPGLSSGALFIKNFDVTTFAYHWESDAEANEKTKRFTSADITAVIKKLEKTGAGCDRTTQLSLELNL